MVFHVIKNIHVKEYDPVVNTFLIGYGIAEAIQQKWKVLLLAYTSEKMKHLEALFHYTIVDEDDGAKRYEDPLTKKCINCRKDNKVLENFKLIYKTKEPLSQQQKII